MKTQIIESRCYRTGKYTVCGRVYASFSPEILQVVAVKGLIYQYLADGSVLCKMCGPMKRCAFRKISLSLFRLVNLCVSGNVFYVMEFRDIFITLLNKFDESKNSR